MQFSFEPKVLPGQLNVLRTQPTGLPTSVEKPELAVFDGSRSTQKKKNNNKTANKTILKKNLFCVQYYKAKLPVLMTCFEEVRR